MSWGNTPEFERYQLRNPNLFERLLAIFFPPKIGKCGYLDVETNDNEQGWAGNVRRKKYRDGIDRVTKEGLDI